MNGDHYLSAVIGGGSAVEHVLARLASLALLTLLFLLLIKNELVIKRPKILQLIDATYKDTESQCFTPSI